MAKQQWYYDLRTGEVSQARRSPWESRMGPYPTEEEAKAALERAASRNDAFDAQDEAWDGQGGE